MGRVEFGNGKGLKIAHLHLLPPAHPLPQLVDPSWGQLPDCGASHRRWWFCRLWLVPGAGTSSNSTFSWGLQLLSQLTTGLSCDGCCRPLQLGFEGWPQGSLASPFACMHCLQEGNPSVAFQDPQTAGTGHIPEVSWHHGRSQAILQCSSKREGLHHISAEKSKVRKM